MPTSLNKDETNKVLDRLFDINYQSKLSIEELTDAYLKLGQDLLGMELGILSQVEGSEYKIFSVTENDLNLVARQSFEIGDTLCKEVFEKNEIVFHGHLSKLAEKKNHPSVKNMKIESYLGLPLYVGNKLFGTLNFNSSKARQELSTLEMIVMKTMTAHLGKKLTQEIDASMYRMILRNIAHELRAPLNGIIGSEDILRDTELTHDQYEMLDLINRSSQTLEQAISEISYATMLLYYSKKGECAYPHDLLEKVLLSCKETLHSRGVHSVVKFEELPPLKCSQDIFENAVRLIIKDSISREYERKEIIFEYEEDSKSEYVNLIIKDNGPCLSKNVTHVLNSFGTIEGIQKGLKINGVNLDLTLAAISMNLAGGYLRAYVAPDNSSTTFILSFPRLV